jgi:pimeloyl-ACP methyl ester carboxylesterase
LVQWANPFTAVGMEKTALNDHVRACMPDKTFVRLSDGVTHYEWAGPDDGQVVVLVHGLTSPSFIWDYQFHALARAGFRVLRYDLFGRGYSDRPWVRYNAEVFNRQLLELLDALEVTQPVDLVALSMGTAIAMDFITRHPERVRRFGLFGPVGFMVHVPLRYKIFKAPVLGDIIIKLFGNQILTKSLQRQLMRDPQRQEELRDRYLEQMRFKGYKRAVLSTSRHHPVLNLEPLYRRVGELGHKGIMFWGRRDHVTPFQHHQYVQQAIPGIEFHAFDNVGHTLNYEAPEVVNPKLIAFLKA